MQLIFILAQIAIAIAQLFAYLDGMQLYFGLGAILSFIIFVLVFFIPVLGATFVAVMTYHGARYGWQWEWYQALLLAIPGVIVSVAILVVGGLASIFTRRAY